MRPPGSGTYAYSRDLGLIKEKLSVRTFILPGRGGADIFIWGGHWRGLFCNKGSCQWSVQDFNAVAWRHTENFGGPLGGPGKILGGKWPSLAPP